MGISNEDFFLIQVLLWVNRVGLRFDRGTLEGVLTIYVYKYTVILMGFLSVKMELFWIENRLRYNLGQQNFMRSIFQNFYKV